MEIQTSARASRPGRKGIISILVLLLLLATGVGVLFFFKYQHAVGSDPSGEQRRIISKIEHVVALPDENPSLSTVVDKTKFTNQTLKARSENGDKLLIYAKAKRLIIYRPSTSKVVDMLTIQENQPAAATNTTEASL